MDYKEKLRLAKEALESGSYDKDTIEYIFPELKENEDERIRKSLIILLQHFCKGYRVPGLEFPISYKDMLVWLEKQGKYETIWKPTREQIAALTHFVRSVGESGYASPYDNNTKLLYSLLTDLQVLEKQGEKKPNPVLDIEIPFGAKDSELQEASYRIPEGFHAEIEGNRVVIKRGKQKPTNKIEPKFHEGDWVILDGNPNSTYRVEKIENSHYVLRHILGGVFYIPFGLEYSMRPWTIQDAKDGDILVDSLGNPFIYAGCTDEYTKCYIALCGIEEPLDLTDFSCAEEWEDKNYAFPATKEQRDLLFAKMEEAGYEWDAEKKQLVDLTIKEALDKEKQLDADIDLYYQTYGNGHNAFDSLSLEKFRDIIKQFINDYK